MFGATLVPAGHFSLDDSRVDSIVTCGNFLVRHLPDNSITPLLERIEAASREMDKMQQRHDKRNLGKSEKDRTSAPRRSTSATHV